MNDPSYHLTISEYGKGYYCFRNPKHSGKNLAYIFKKLGIEFDKELLKAIGPAPTYERIHSKKDYSLWQWFKPALEDEEALNYLASRHFLFPSEVAKKFDLRIAPNGHWAGRLLIPLTVGWTGRSMRDYIEPRYLSETNETGLLILGSGPIAIKVEGPIDALRIASITLTKFTVIASLGQRISPTLLIFLREKRFPTIYDFPDSDVSFVDAEYNRRALASLCTKSVVKKLSLPVDIKDIAELTEIEAREWLMRLGSTSPWNEYMKTEGYKEYD